MAGGFCGIEPEAGPLNTRKDANFARQARRLPDTPFISFDSCVSWVKKSRSRIFRIVQPVTSIRLQLRAHEMICIFSKFETTS